MRLPGSIAVLLPLAVLLTTMVGGALTIGFALHQRVQETHDHAALQLQLRANRLAGLAEALLSEHPGLVEEDVMFAAISLGDARIALIDPDGQVRFAHDSSWKGRPIGELAPEVSFGRLTRATAGAVGDSRTDAAGTVVDILYPFDYRAASGQPLATERGAIFIAKDIAGELRHAYRSGLGFQLLLFGILLLLAGLLALWLHLSLVRPIQGIAAASRRLGIDDEVRVAERGTGEVRDLTRAFNDMARQLAEQHRAQGDQLALLQTILEQAPDAIQLVDADTLQMVEVNAASCQMLGYTRAELMAQRVSDFQADMPPAQIEAVVRESQAKGGVHFITRHRRKDGTHIDAEVGLRALRLQSRNLLLAIWRDITEATRTQQRLRKLSLAVEQSPNPVMITNLRPAIEYVNDAFVRNSGYSRDDVLGRNPNILESGRTPAATCQAMSDALAAGTPWRGETINLTAQGEEQVMDTTIIPLKQEDGTVTHHVALTENITGRIAMQRELERHRDHLEHEVRLRTAELTAVSQSLRSSNAEQQALFDAATVGIVFVRERRIVRANRTLERMFGYAPGEMLGQETRAWYADAEDFDAIGQRVSRSVRVAGFHHEERELVRKDGSRFWGRMTAQAIDRNDLRKGLAGIIVDITAERNAKRALLESHAQQQAILDAASSGIVLVRERVAVRCNRRMHAMLGWPEGELVGQSTRLWYPDDAGFEQAGREAEPDIRGGEMHRREQLLQRRDGSRFWTRMVGQAVEPSDPDQGAVWVVDDITTEREAHAQMAEAKSLAESAARMKAQFLANMSHEIRTPMNAIIGMAHLALGTDLTTRQRGYLEKVEVSARHLLGIIDDILDLSKLEAGKLSVEQIDFNLEEVLGSVTDLVSQRAAAKGLELIVWLDHEVPRRLVGDPLRIGQVLTNFASNAVKFTQHGEVSMHVSLVQRRRRQAELCFEVADTGIGVTAEQRGRLFHQFEQADAGTTRRFGGTGLGLAIAAQLVELMHGEIGVDSTPGLGSRFWFRVPLGIAAGAAADTPRLTQPHVAGVRVLVLEQHPGTREAIATMLLGMGFDVRAVASRADAVAEVRQAAAAGQPFRVALVDGQVPDLRQHAATPPATEAAGGAAAAAPGDGDEAGADADDPRIVIVASHDDEGAAYAAAEANGYAVLIKPVLPSKLLDTLVRVLGGGSERQAVPGRTTRRDLGPIQGARVLLVEDNEINREVAVELLQDAGVVVDTAENGADAVEQVRRAGADGYDLILMDIQMPVMDGLSASRAILALPGGAGLPIVAMTANAMESDRRSCLAAGMKGHLSKPVDPEALWGQLLQWTRRRDGAPAAAVVTATKTDAGSAGLAAIPGIDLAAALRGTLGREDLLLRVLRRFIDDNADLCGQLRAALAAGDRGTAERLAHTLKGSAALIGAVSLQRHAAGLEAAIRTAEAEAGLQSRVDGMEPDLRGLIADIGRALPERPAAAPAMPGSVDQAQLTEVCRTLAEQLEGGNLAAGQTIAGHADLLRRAFGEGFAPLAADIEDFDFEAALERLRGLTAHAPAPDSISAGAEVGTGAGAESEIALD